MFTLPLHRFVGPAPSFEAQPLRQHPLRRHELLAIEQPRGRKIRCSSGRLWLTLDGWQADIVLEAGDSYACETDRRMLVQALSDAIVDIQR